MDLTDHITDHTATAATTTALRRRRRRRRADGGWWSEEPFGVGCRPGADRATAATAAADVRRSPSAGVCGTTAAGAGK